MSTAVVSTSAAPGRPFLFDADSEAELCPGNDGKKPSTGQQGLIAKGSQSTIENQQSAIPFVIPASRLELRPAPEMVPSGIPALDALTGGLPRGCLTEICGPASSGRTSVMLAALAAATRRGEYCAVIDASDALDPRSLAAAGIDMNRLLWIRCGDNVQRTSSSIRPTNTQQEMKSEGAPPLSRTLRQDGDFDFLSQNPALRRGKVDPRCERNVPSEKSQIEKRHSEHRLEQVLRATDLLLESGGFGLIILDLADVPNDAARRIPLTTWFRFRRAIEHKPTILLAIEQQPIAGSCSSLLLKLDEPKTLAEKFSGESNIFKPSNSSREAAIWENPARQCRVDEEEENNSRRDGTLVLSNAAVDEHSPEPIICLTHANLLTKLKIHAELIRSRLDRKPARSITFETKTAWAG